MKKFYLTYYPTAAILLLLAVSTIPVCAQIPVRITAASDDEINKARIALKNNMDDIEAHKTYIYAVGIGDTTFLKAQYQQWIKERPDDVNIPLAIGTVYHNAEMPQAKEFLEQADKIKPQDPQILSMLSADAFTRGDAVQGIRYKEEAMLTDPSNMKYKVSYISSLEKADPDIYKQKVLDFIKQYPTNQSSAYLLYWLASGTTNIDKKISYLEALRKLFPPQKFDWSASGMIELADIYLQKDIQKALALINEMGDGKDWRLRKQLAGSLIKINGCEKDQNYTAAATEIEQVALPKFNYINDYITLRKAFLQEKAGNDKIGYNNLIAKFAKTPTDSLYSLLKLFGYKMNKDSARIAKDVDSVRYNTAVDAYPFNLGLYTGRDSLKLKDLKGKVVLLTFWFPGCSPCREEFPHFEAVMSKFNRKDVVYLAINVFPLQDGYVEPLMKNAKYSFIPLRGTREFAEKHYGVEGEPENFLIDKDGKIVFKNFKIDDTNHRTLELMISSLLNKAPADDSFVTITTTAPDRKKLSH